MSRGVQYFCAIFLSTILELAIMPCTFVLDPRQNSRRRSETDFCFALTSIYAYDKLRDSFGPSRRDLVPEVEAGVRRA